MSKNDNKMNNIFRNYSSHNYIKIHSRMHPIALLHKIFWEEHTLESSSNEIEQRYTYGHDKASGMYYNSSPLSQNSSPCLNMDLYP